MKYAKIDSRTHPHWQQQVVVAEVTLAVAGVVEDTWEDEVVTAEVLCTAVVELPLRLRLRLAPVRLRGCRLRPGVSWVLVRDRFRTTMVEFRSRLRRRSTFVT